MKVTIPQQVEFSVDYSKDVQCHLQPFNKVDLVSKSFFKGSKSRNPCNLPEKTFFESRDGNLLKFISGVLNVEVYEILDHRPQVY